MPTIPKNVPEQQAASELAKRREASISRIAQRVAYKKKSKYGFEDSSNPYKSTYR